MKQKKRLKKPIRYFIMVVLITIMVFSGCKIILYAKHSHDNRVYFEDMASQVVINNIDNEDPYSFEVKYEELLKQNGDLSGWIRIEGTNIDYPVMLTSQDEQYYLRRGFDKDYDSYGVPFFNAEFDPYDNNHRVIYAHNNHDGSMFGGLEDYKDKNFYDNHRYIELDTLSAEEKYEIAYVIVCVDDPRSDLFVNFYDFIENNDESTFNAQINRYEALALYTTGVDVEYGDQLLTLSTCEYNHTNGRLVVIAKKLVD